MSRFLDIFAIVMLATFVPPLRADAFERYINAILAKVPAAEGVKELKQLTRKHISDHDGGLPGITGAFVVVKTNDGRRRG